jgi:hypothetical protein
MALGTVYGANYTKAFLTNPPAMIEQGESGGKVKCIYDVYTLPSGVIDVGDIVLFGGAKLPKGAKVVDATLKHASLGITGVVTLGYAASDDGAESAVPAAFVTGSAAGSAVYSKPAAGNTGIFKELLGDVQLTLGCTTISTNTTVKIEVAVFYIVD